MFCSSVRSADGPVSAGELPGCRRGIAAPAIDSCDKHRSAAGSVIWVPGRCFITRPAELASRTLSRCATGAGRHSADRSLANSSPRRRRTSPASRSTPRPSPSPSAWNVDGRRSASRCLRRFPTLLPTLADSALADSPPRSSCHFSMIRNLTARPVVNLSDRYSLDDLFPPTSRLSPHPPSLPGKDAGQPLFYMTFACCVNVYSVYGECTRAARKENPNTNPKPNSHGHCLLSKWKCDTCAHTHLCN